MATHTARTPTQTPHPHSTRTAFAHTNLIRKHARQHRIKVQRHAHSVIDQLHRVIGQIARAHARVGLAAAAAGAAGAAHAAIDRETRETEQRRGEFLHRREQGGGRHGRRRV